MYKFKIEYIAQFNRNPGQISITILFIFIFKYSSNRVLNEKLRVYYIADNYEYDHLIMKNFFRKLKFIFKSFL
jgi:hypothetical protein